MSYTKNETPETVRNGPDKKYMVEFLPYAGLEPYANGWRYGSFEEFFATRLEAEARMRELRSARSVERVCIREERKGYARGVLVVEWDDSDAPENTP